MDYPVLNQRRWQKYLDFCKNMQNRPITAEGELHHIIPRCCGGSNDRSNLVHLPYREHFIVHMVLPRIIDNPKLWYVARLMRRVCKGKSSLYEASRKYIKAAVLLANVGRAVPDDQKRLMSERTKGKVVVTDGNRTFQTSTDDPRYISGELVYYRTGTTHSDETKAAMSANGILGKVMCHDPGTNKYRYVFPDELPDGYVWGPSPEFCKGKSANAATLWFTNDETGDTIRLSITDPIPAGYTRGRRSKNHAKDGRFIKTDFTPAELAKEEARAKRRSTRKQAIST